MHQLGDGPRKAAPLRGKARAEQGLTPVQSHDQIHKPTSLEAIQLLTSVGQALSAEKDRDALMERILRAAKQLTAADGGTLYSRTTDDRLKFEIMLTDSLGLSLGGTTGLPIIYPPLPLRDSAGQPNLRMVAARAAISGKTVNIPDAYDTSEFDFSGTREFDAKTGYRSKSFLTVPIKSLDDEVIGVLQLINAQAPDSGTLPFSLEDQRLVESLASQAGIALTNRRLMVELRQARDEAEQSSQYKSQFVANISHELRTPMTVILGMTRLALETELDADQQDMLQTVSASANSLLNVLNDVLDFSKIEAGKLDLESEEFAPRETVRDALRTLAEKAQGKGLELLCSIDSQVPGRVLGDSGRLRQVLVNLVGNAIKFTAKGEVTLSAEVADADEDCITVHFKVADTGCGISSEKQALIFDSFTQADGSTTRSHGGTGLGLAISKQLVGLMGGDLWVESVPRVGSTFHFTIRFKRTDAANAATEPPKELLGVRALVVDDHPKSLKITTDLLAHWGLRVDAVGNAASALAAIQQAACSPASYRLVLADACMPGMSGFELAETVGRSQEPGLALTPPGFLIMLSALGQRGDQTERCVQKPIFEPELREAILATLGYGTVVQSPASLSPTPESTAKTAPRPRSTRTLKILVAEDSALNQKLVARLLANEGHHATLVADGLKALTAYATETFDLILMDVQMPELGGIETTREIRRREMKTGRHTPIVAFTASAMKGDRERCLKAGMDAYISKPLYEEQLLELVDSLANTPQSEARPIVHKSKTPDPVKLAPAGQAPAAQVFDPVKTLARCGGKVEFAREIIDLFLKTASELIDDLSNAIASGDGDSLHRVAHRLKGAATAVSGTRVEAVAQRLSETGKNGEFGIAIGLLPRLDQELDRLKEALLVFRAELDG